MKKKVVSIVLAAAMPLSAFGGLNCFASTKGEDSLKSLNYSEDFLRAAVSASQQNSNLPSDDLEGWEISEDETSENDQSVSSSSEFEEEEQEQNSSKSRGNASTEENTEAQTDEEEEQSSSKLRRGVSGIKECASSVSKKVSDKFVSLKQGASNASKKVSEKFVSLKQGVSNASKKACETISAHKLETALCVGGIALAAGSAYNLYKINSRLNDLYELTGNKNYDEEVCSADGVQAKFENFKGLTKAGFIAAASKTKNTFVNVKDSTKDSLASAANKTKKAFVTLKDATKDSLTSAASKTRNTFVSLKDATKDSLTSAASKTKNTFMSLKDSAKNKVSATFEAIKANKINRANRANKKLREFYGLSEECPNIKEKECKASSLRNFVFNAKNWIGNNISGKLRKNNSNEGRVAKYSINKNNNNSAEGKNWILYQIGDCYCACAEK